MDKDSRQVWDVAFRGKDENGNSTWMWYNYVTGETRPLDYQFVDGELQQKCDETELKSYKENKQEKESPRIEKAYFEITTEIPPKVIEVIVHEPDYNPQVDRYQSYRSSELFESPKCCDMWKKSNPLSECEFLRMCEDGEIKDRNMRIPVAVVVYPRVPADQVIHCSPYDKDYHKYGPDGSKAPSNIWTVFPAMTAIFLIFGLIALPMEGGIPFGIGLFILWCVGMYKNAEHKSYWDGQHKKEEQNRIERISRQQRRE